MKRSSFFVLLPFMLATCLFSGLVWVGNGQGEATESCWNVTWLGKSLCLPNNWQERRQVQSAIQEALDADLKATRERMGLLPYKKHLKQISDLAREKDELLQQRKPHIQFCRGELSLRKDDPGPDRACLAKKRRNAAHNAAVWQKVEQIEAAERRLAEATARFDKIKSQFRIRAERWDQLFDVAELDKTRDRLATMHQELYRLQDELRQAKAEAWETRATAESPIKKRASDLYSKIEAMRDRISAARFQK